ncbi:MAG TPA: hypothetical protein VL359_05575, partial [bacterium]|nr:hypothetical protein [bacterium]
MDRLACPRSTASRGGVPVALSRPALLACIFLALGLALAGQGHTQPAGAPAGGTPPAASGTTGGSAGAAPPGAATDAGTGAGQPLPSPEPSQDILIEGIGFSKLTLQLQGAQAQGTSSDLEFTRLEGLLEKNLCWSGVFNLAGGQSRFCALTSPVQRTDMKLDLAAQGDALTLRLKDAGPAQLVLYQDQLPLKATTREAQVMDLVNHMTERITGQPGLLGSTIAFSLREPGFAKVIAATNTQGQRLELLSHNQDINLLPRWSPSGTSLVYTILSHTGSRVYFQNLVRGSSGDGPSRFLTPPGSLNTGGAFSPDGHKLVLTMSPHQNADLYEYDLTTDHVRQVTSRLGIETQADWSAQGNQLTFVSDRAGSPQVYLMDLGTGEDLRLTFDGPYNTDPRFSPDGRLILFTKRVDGKDEVYIMDT